MDGKGSRSSKKANEGVKGEGEWWSQSDYVMPIWNG